MQNGCYRIFMVDCGKLATGVILRLPEAALQARRRRPVFLLKNKHFTRLPEMGAAWQQEKSDLFRPM
jgi:hypothetical protein